MHFQLQQTAVGALVIEARKQAAEKGLAASMNQCMKCWETILPCTLRHPTLKIDLPAVLNNFQKRYQGAMYSGCGGGYLYVVSDRPVPGAFKVQIRTAKV